ncbi:MAG: sigma-70 family RNA polymerase sigma factor [Planctomycetes bacterium]|nr:sigma-70 family RNA polymerase sigma factor [Planctomycetota bacterium]
MKPCPELVTRAQRDRTAESLGALVAATRDDVFHFLTRHLGHAADAEDATQETFRRMIRSLPSLREPAAFPGWIHRIALRAAHDIIRGRAARRHLAEDLSRNAPATEEAAMSDAERRETRDKVRSAVDTLDADLRATVILRYEQGLSYAEIAQAMECPEGTVGKRLHTAHERLHKALAGAGVALAMALLERELAAEPRVRAPERLVRRLGTAVREEVELLAVRGKRPWRRLGAGAGVLAVVLAVWIGLRVGKGGLRGGDGEGAAAPVGASGAVAAAGEAARPGGGALESGGTTEEAGNPVPASSAKLAGRVTDRATGLPISGARVRLKPDSAAGNEVATESASDGSWSLAAAPGEYRLEVSAAGYAPFFVERAFEAQRVLVSTLNQETEEESDRIRAERKVTLAAGESASRDVSLVSGVDVHGIVTDVNLRPLGGVHITFQGNTLAGDGWSFSQNYDPGGGDWHDIVTDSSGRFTLVSLYPLGRAGVSASLEGYQPADVSFELSPPSVEVRVEMRRGSEVSGTVVDARGVAVEGARILTGMPDSMDGGTTELSSARVSTDFVGRFVIRDLPDGVKVIAACAPGHGVAVAGLSAGPIILALPDADTVLKGAVRDSAGRPLAGVRVAATQVDTTAGGMEAHFGFTDADGGAQMSGAFSGLRAFLPREMGMPEATTDAAGNFELKGVWMGEGATIRLKLEKEGYRDLRPSTASALWQEFVMTIE